MSEPIKEAMFLRVLQPAMEAMYADLMPAGYSIYKLAEYDPKVHSAPNLWLERHEKPEAKYLAILVNDTGTVPALGETVTDAINAAILKIEQRKGGAQ